MAIYYMRCGILVNMADKKRLVVIDGKSVFYRGYYAMPNLSTKNGTPTGGVYGFAVMALEVIKKMNPDFVCVAWDKSKTNIRRRKKIYPEYKAGRKPPPPDFYEQIPVLHRLLEAFNWPLYEIDDHEADDIMGTFAKQAAGKGYETLLITSDLDVLQLVNSSTKVCALKRGLTNTEVFDEEHFREKYSMQPLQFIDFKALRGDASDNVPGVKGVGEKTAAELIAKYQNLEGVYANLDEIKPSLRQKLEADKDIAFLSRQLVTLDLDIDLPLDWEHAKMDNIHPEQVIQILQELEFRTLINQLPESLQSSVDEAISTASTNLGQKWITEIISASGELEKIDLRDDRPVFIHVLCKGKQGQDLQTLAFSWGENKVTLIHVNKIAPKHLVKFVTKLARHKIVGYDTKKIIQAFYRLGAKIENVEHDILIGAFLLNSLIRDQSLNGLVRDSFGIETDNLDSPMPDRIESAMPSIIDAVFRIYNFQVEKLSKLPKLQKLAEQIEWPFIPVIAKMELDGIKLDTKYLKKMGDELEGIISDTEQQIYGYAEAEFNIASPSQLAEILFGKLKLPADNIKKGKTGFSTAASELNKLRLLHPIIDLISTFRELTKLKNTYVDALPKLVDENNKLHTTFALTVAQTGRLSSHDPNLQNIPVRSEIGHKIRRAFIPEEDNLFVSADYSQFELRLAAALADDKELIREFNEGLDVHTQTAALVNNIDPSEVTKNQRRQAKVINFGILYGMSPHGLSVATGMSQHEAAGYIKRYFEYREPLLKYIEKTRSQAHELGYVETMFGRRRPTPDVRSSNWVVRQAAERAAINMPIQGTEADIMKMAMIKIQQKLDQFLDLSSQTSNNIKPRMLLQIHDSILVECKKEDAKEVGQLLKDTMEAVCRLPVKLDVDISAGKNWGEL